MLRKSRSTMRKITAFEDIRASLRDAVCFRLFQTRAEARAYVRMPLSRQQFMCIAPVYIASVATKLSALADSERSPAIHRRVSVENACIVA